MSVWPFRDRRDAGRKLAARLSSYANRPDVLVLALPRGGVPVAYEVARSLGPPLDIFVVRKLGVPGYEEVAMGAVATGGVRVLNDEIVSGLGIPSYVIEAVAARAQKEVTRRERAYRGGRHAPDARGRTVILVDDGLATGATMKAAILALGRWYEDFSQTTDEEVRTLLAPRQAQMEAERPRTESESALVEAVRASAQPLTGSARDYDLLMDRIGDTRFVLLGEASHGTHEFYRERAEITKRLIAEKGFRAVAVEADWPDAYRVNRYVRAVSSDVDATEALADFRRFPTWMWRNTDVFEFVEWMRAHNDAVPAAA